MKHAARPCPRPRPATAHGRVAEGRVRLSDWDSTLGPGRVSRLGPGQVSRLGPGRVSRLGPGRLGQGCSGAGARAGLCAEPGWQARVCVLVLLGSSSNQAAIRLPRASRRPLGAWRGWMACGLSQHGTQRSRRVPARQGRVFAGEWGSICVRYAQQARTGVCSRCASA